MPCMIDCPKWRRRVVLAHNACASSWVQSSGRPGLLTSPKWLPRPDSHRDSPFRKRQACLLADEEVAGVVGFEPTLKLVRSERDFPVADTPVNYLFSLSTRSTWAVAAHDASMKAFAMPSLPALGDGSSCRITPSGSPGRPSVVTDHNFLSFEISMMIFINGADERTRTLSSTMLEPSVALLCWHPRNGPIGWTRTSITAFAGRRPVSWTTTR